MELVTEKVTSATGPEADIDDDGSDFQLAVTRIAPHSVREVQFPNRCLEARLLAQRIHKWVGFQQDEPSVPQTQGLLEPT